MHRCCAFSFALAGIFLFKQLLFLITDGTPTKDAEWTVPEADATKAAGIEIFVVGVTQQVTITLLREIASDPINTHLYYVESFDRLPG